MANRKSSTADKKKIVGTALQRMRKIAGYKSAKAFAEAVGINPNTYTDWEQGRHMLSYEQAWQLADALECSMDELGGRQWPPEGTSPAALAADEAALVGDYRRMDEGDRPGFMTTAHALAYAGEAKKEGERGLPQLAGRDVT